MGNCNFCGRKAGFLRRKHKECAAANVAGWREMTKLAARAAAAPDFNKAVLQHDLAEIAQRSWVDQECVRAAIAQGWREAMDAVLADGIITQGEESRLRAFRDRLALESSKANESVMAQLDRAAEDRLVLDARLSALAVNGSDIHLQELEAALEGSSLSPAEQRRVLITGWEAAVEGVIEDGVPTLDEETALTRYLGHFNLSAGDVNANGVHRNLVETAVIREAAEGLIPQRFKGGDQLPLNLQKSEQLVWAFNGVDYYELKTRRERQGTSHGVSIRIARGLYYSPRQFRSQTHEWDETVHVDTGLLAVTSKHVYFHGARKRFRVRFDRIISFEQFNDGFGLMREAQSAKPQSFRTGDGWFVYNLVTNLAQR